MNTEGKKIVVVDVYQYRHNLLAMCSYSINTVSVSVIKYLYTVISLYIIMNKKNCTL